MADAALADGVGYSFHTWWMSYPIVSGMPPCGQENRQRNGARDGQPLKLAKNSSISGLGCLERPAMTHRSDRPRSATIGTVRVDGV